MRMDCNWVVLWVARYTGLATRMTDSIYLLDTTTGLGISDSRYRSRRCGPWSNASWPLAVVTSADIQASCAGVWIGQRLSDSSLSHCLEKRQIRRTGVSLR